MEYPLHFVTLFKSVRVPQFGIYTCTDEAIFRLIQLELVMQLTVVLMVSLFVWMKRLSGQLRTRRQFKEKKLTCVVRFLAQRVLAVMMVDLLKQYTAAELFKTLSVQVFRTERELTFKRRARKSRSGSIGRQTRVERSHR